MGETRHGHPRFYELLDELADLHSRKNHDYAGTDPLSNLRVSEEFGIPAWKGVLVRMSDKWRRIVNLATKEALVTNESIKDTLRDMAVYALLDIILIEEEEARGTMRALNEEIIAEPGDVGHGGKHGTPA